MQVISSAKYATCIAIHSDFIELILIVSDASSRGGMQNGNHSLYINMVLHGTLAQGSRTGVTGIENSELNKVVD